MHYKDWLRAPIASGNGWNVDHVRHGAGMSSTTYGHAELGNGVWVFQRYWQPGPFHALAYGVDSDSARPEATYSVFSGVHGAADEGLPLDALLEKMKALHPNMDVNAARAATVEVWSPDGEGAIYLKFTDLEVEQAFALASTLVSDALLDLNASAEPATVPA